MSDLELRLDGDTAVTVLDGGTELCRYVYRPDTPLLESPKPYISPLRTRAGRLVSLFRPWDHVWHKGIAWSLPVIDDENFWGGPTYVHGRFYVQMDNNGTQRHREPIRASGAADSAAISHGLDWITQSGERIFSEERALGVTVLSADAWALTFDTAMTNTTDRDIAIGSPTTRGRENAGYGGLFWRGPRSFTSGTLVSPGGMGGDELRGQRHEWMAFAGRHDEDDAASIVVMVDHGENPYHPPQWFARSQEFACLNPAPFFSEEVIVPAGQTVRFRYGVGIAEGGTDAAAPLAAAVRNALNEIE
jgi:hypothetical protein